MPKRNNYRVTNTSRVSKKRRIVTNKGNKYGGFGGGGNGGYNIKEDNQTLIEYCLWPSHRNLAVCAHLLDPDTRAPRRGSSGGGRGGYNTVPCPPSWHPCPDGSCAPPGKYCPHVSRGGSIRGGGNNGMNKFTTSRGGSGARKDIQPSSAYCPPNFCAEGQIGYPCPRGRGGDMEHSSPGCCCKDITYRSR